MGIEHTAGARNPIEIMELQTREALRAILCEKRCHVSQRQRTAAKVTLAADVIERSGQAILTLVICRPLLPRNYGLYIY